jgi:hypothetical protein
VHGLEDRDQVVRAAVDLHRVADLEPDALAEVSADLAGERDRRFVRVVPVDARVRVRASDRDRRPARAARDVGDRRQPLAAERGHVLDAVHVGLSDEEVLRYSA